MEPSIWQPFFKIVFAELVLYIEETRQDEETAPILKLAELAQLYKLEQLGVKVDTRINSTRLGRGFLLNSLICNHTRREEMS